MNHMWERAVNATRFFSDNLLDLIEGCRFDLQGLRDVAEARYVLALSNADHVEQDKSGVEAADKLLGVNVDPQYVINMVNAVRLGLVLPENAIEEAGLYRKKYVGDLQNGYREQRILCERTEIF